MTELIYQSPIGFLCCRFEGHFLISLDIAASPPHQPSAENISDHKKLFPPLFLKELDAYFRGSMNVFTQKIRYLHGTHFERSIWESTRRIPFGQTFSYGQIAELAGHPGAARAAGQALGKNRIMIIVPCHRVVAADGSIGGFSSGTQIKKWLIAHEKQALSYFEQKSG